MGNNTFFAYQALRQQPNWAAYLRYGIIIVGAVVIAAYLGYRIRHQQIAKYRDLLVLVVLAVLLTLGIQVRDIQANRSATQNSRAVVALMTSVAKEKHVPVTAVYVNSTSLTSGMLVQLDHNVKQTYSVTLDSNSDSFTLAKTHLINAKCTYVEE